jgi:hypothetical protein
MILNYALGYLSFLLGMLIYLLGKMDDNRKLAEANPNPNVKASFKDMLSREWINLVRLAVAGLALVLFLPQLIGGTEVSFQNSHGVEIGKMAIKAALSPFYFLTAMSGSSAVFAIFGKYRKDLLKGIGVEEEKP